MPRLSSETGEAMTAAHDNRNVSHVPWQARVFAVGRPRSDGAAHVRLDPASPIVRVRYRLESNERGAAGWRCDSCGPMRSPDCPHARAITDALPHLATRRTP